MRYQILRSVRDKKIHVISGDGSFDSLPDDIRKLGPWQSLKRGDLERLKSHYRLQLAEQGFVVVHQSMAPSPPTTPNAALHARAPLGATTFGRASRYQGL
jgi:hypothetical protein